MLRKTTNPIIEFPSLFIDHAHSLLRETNHYIESLACDETIETDPTLWLQYTTEISIISLRLNNVITWAMAQQEIADGKSCTQCITQLKGRVVGMKNSPEKVQNFPAHLKYLLKASHALFMQAVNIEDQTNALNASQPTLTLIQ